MQRKGNAIRRESQVKESGLITRLPRNLLEGIRIDYALEEPNKCWN